VLDSDNKVRCCRVEVKCLRTNALSCLYIRKETISHNFHMVFTILL